MFSSFTKLLPNNVSLSAPDFLKPLTGNTITSTAGTNASSPANQHTTKTAPAPTTTTTAVDTGKDKKRAVDPHQESQISTTAENELANGAKEKKKRKDIAATETFIIVRPPPSMSNHPLNLQVQLVASQGIKERKQRSASTSTTGTTDIRHSNESRETLNDDYTGGASLQRTTSLRSTRSDTESTYSASSTLSTFNSGSSSSGRRMIPLYNLHAHNVMTNVITDAGTDAKIAKFFKRGLEIMGLAMLEPVEVYGKYGWNEEGDSLHPSGGFGSQIYRTTSNLVRNITPNIPPPQHAELPTVIEVPSSPTTPKPSEKDTPKKLFGNLFKKKKDPPAPLSLAPNAPGSTENISTPLSSKRKSNTPSVVVSSPSAQQTSLGLGTPTTASMNLPGGNEVVLQSQVLGLQAVLQSSVLPPKGRPSTYVWVVKKWIKGSNEGIFEQLGGQIGGAMNALGSNVGNMISNTTSGGGGSGFTTVSNGGSGFAQQPAHSGPINGVMGGVEVEVRFEWRRGSRKGERRRKMATGSTIGGGSTINGEGHERRHSTQLEPPSSSSHRYSANLEPDPTPTVANKRLSFQGFGKKSPPTLPLGERDTNASTEQLKYSRAPSPNPPASVTTTGTTDEHGKKVDDGEESESDPEDSERPWNCYLHIRALPHTTNSGLPNGSSRTTSRSQSRDELSVHSSDHDPIEKEKVLDIKLRAACLAPAPHHPKVIAQIKAPYPLPDLVLDSRPGGNGAMLRERADNNQSTANVNEKDGVEKGTLVLTAEEIKDVVSCTGLWLVVREGYGGLARKRKGDGWRLRG